MFRSTFISTILLFTACHPSQSGFFSADVQSTSAAQRGPLPIVGSWQATEVWTNNPDQPNRTAVHATEDELKKGLWRIKIEIDSSGEGLIEGLVNCQGPVTAMSTPAKLRPQQLVNALFGTLSLPKLIERTKDSIQCAASANGGLPKLLPVYPARTFFGQNLNSLSKNLGVFGEGNNSSAADAECRKLRGVRFVNINDASACVGFTDSSANRLRFLIVPAGEVYAVRVNLRRD